MKYEKTENREVGRVNGMHWSARGAAWRWFTPKLEPLHVVAERMMIDKLLSILDRLFSAAQRLPRTPQETFSCCVYETV